MGHLNNSSLLFQYECCLMGMITFFWVFHCLFSKSGHSWTRFLGSKLAFNSSMLQYILPINRISWSSSNGLIRIQYPQSRPPQSPESPEPNPFSGLVGLGWVLGPRIEPIGFLTGAHLGAHKTHEPHWIRVGLWALGPFIGFAEVYLRVAFVSARSIQTSLVV